MDTRGMYGLTRELWEDWTVAEGAWNIRPVEVLVTGARADALWDGVDG